MFVVAEYILAVKACTSIDQPTCLVGPPALFCVHFKSGEAEVEFWPTNMP